MTLEELFKGRNIDIDAVMTKLRSVAQSENLPFGDRTKSYNSRKSQELGKWAEEEGRGDAYHLSVFKAYFSEGLNIGLESVLLDIVRDLGLPEEKAKHVLAERSFSSAVDADWERSYRSGITAVPTFAMNGRSLVGAQPYSALEALVMGR